MSWKTKSNLPRVYFQQGFKAGFLQQNQAQQPSTTFRFGPNKPNPENIDFFHFPRI